MANDEYSSCIHQWALKESSLKAKSQLLLIPIRPVTSIFLASISSFTWLIFVRNWQLRPFNVFFNKVQLLKFPFSSYNEIYHRILLEVTLATGRPAQSLSISMNVHHGFLAVPICCSIMSSGVAIVKMARTAVQQQMRNCWSKHTAKST